MDAEHESKPERELTSSVCGKEPVSARQLLRQQRELEEKRKFGLAPLAIDSVTGQEISTNVPHTMTEAPWYYGAAGPTLEHHRHHTDTADDVLQDSTTRIIVKGKATRFVAGACKNCGSRTHKTRECTQAKKKIGAHYSGKITGVDVEVQQGDQDYSMKRDRFVGDVGVDLLRGSVGEGGIEDSVTTATPVQQRKTETVFDAQTARHGGTEIKELPKYLQNLDAPEGVFFDPKTGSMRANPNAANPARAFHGDLERYRSGNFYDYVETQYRFLAGQSKSFVDFEYDAVMRQRKEGNHGGTLPAASAVPPAATENVLVRTLYGADHHGTPGVSGGEDSGTTVVEGVVLQGSSSRADPEATTEHNIHEEIRLCLSLQQASDGHNTVFGSFFDTVSLAWGYKCCGGVNPNTAGCQTVKK